MCVSRMVRAALLAVLALIVGASGCAGGAPGPTKLTISAAEYSFSGVPDTIGAGLVEATLVNRGRTEHEAWFVKVKEGTTRATVVDSVPAINLGGAFPSFMLASTGVHSVAPGERTTMTFNLTPGHYFILCDDSGVPGKRRTDTLHFQRGMITPLEVTGTGGTELPPAEDTLTAGDYWFDTSQLRAGRHTVLFRNVGPEEWHVSALLEFPPGTTKAQAEDAMAEMLKGHRLQAGVKALHGGEAASPGYGNTFTATFTKGRVYVVLDFLSDRSGGPPHLIGHHMWKVFEVR